MSRRERVKVLEELRALVPVHGRVVSEEEVGEMEEARVRGG